MTAGRSGDLPGLIVIGASAGGVQALRSVVERLPADLPASVLIVLHLAPDGSSALAGILGNAGKLPTTSASHGAIIEPGHVYVAPPDHHLLVDEARMLLSDRPPESGHRPGVDALFRSAARTRGSSVVGVVLSGALDDGTAGLVEIKAHGGVAIVQDPEEAAYRGMPDSALANVQVDHVLPAAEIGEQLGRILGMPRAGSGKTLSLPISQLDQTCREGSAPASGAPDEEIQVALWLAVRTLEEKAGLNRRMAAAARLRGTAELARRYEETLEETAAAALVLRRWLTSAAPPAQGGRGGREQE
jgi:two-component system chemotaxis response regulator CheB